MAAMKWQNLPISAKLEIIRRVERTEKKSDVAAAYSIQRSMLSMILKNKANVWAKADKRPGATGAQRIRTAAYEDVEAAVYKWFIDRFKECHSIVGLAVTSESCAVDVSSVHKWIEENWSDIRSRYHPRDIFNADWAGIGDGAALFWQMLPNKMLVCRDDKSHGGKVNKARISMLLTINVD
ncbi:hypothetical protein HPB49_023494 [Dermacentor silvarum]|uniref:Uncharacterized protein n=1 Tax=Dermacentor silvarum TaxID=543639 RepID=A0ACB8DLF1_DERSI|nr:hypothetical protein HPB49_023494 [Dermacentor silvarum]